jgi:benzoyl-CoA reductase/2-hydroxyglutaryl-CoA dehydratase subunit BcrC/BadD/HgdB
MSCSSHARGGAEAPPHVVSTLSLSWPGREGTPAALEYFRQRGDEQGAVEALRAARAGGRKVVGVFCTFIPEEIILGVNAVPVRLCGGAPPAGPDDLPRETCPVAKAALDTVRSGPLAGVIDAAVLPTTCDWKVQAAGRLADRLPVIRVPLPRSADPRVLSEAFLQMARELEEAADFSLTTSSLRRALQVTARARAAHRQIEELRRRPLPPLSGCEAMLIADSYGYGDIEGWTKACEELAAAPMGSPSGGWGPRIVLFGSPMIWPNYKVPYLVEASGGVVVGDDFCSRRSRLHAPDVAPGSLRDMLSALAWRAVEPCTCGSVAKASTRQRALLSLVNELDADGVICHYLRGCAPVAAGQAAVASALRDGGVPSLPIETDASQEDIEGLRTRIEAFLETLEAQHDR